MNKFSRSAGVCVLFVVALVSLEPMYVVKLGMALMPWKQINE